MTAVNTVFGPASLVASGLGATSTLLNDADDSVAFTFTIPKSGTITDIGVLCATVTGDPPAYNAGLVTVTAATGAPTATAYGGSSLLTKDFTVAQWEWFTLVTPATAVVGEVASVRIWPTASAPDGTNYVGICTTLLGTLTHPRVSIFSVGWTDGQGHVMGWAIRYNDGKVYGIPATSNSFALVELESDTTPDELGALFTIPADMVCAGARIGCAAVDGNAPYTVRLYDSLDNILASVATTDEDELSAAGVKDLYWAPVSLIANAQYRLTILATSTTLGITPAGITFESAASLANNILLPEATRWQKTERTDAGAWTDTPTVCPIMALIISDITFSAGGGVGLGEVVGRSSAMRRWAAEGIGLAEGIGKALVLGIMALFAYAAERLGLTEAPSGRRTLRRVSAEVVDLGESTPARRAMLRRVWGTLGIGESVRGLRRMLARVAENLGLKEAASRRTVQLRLVAEALGIDEVGRGLRTMRRWAAEQLAVLEAVVKQRGMLRLASEAVGLTEEARGLRTMRRWITEALGLREVLTRPVRFLRLVAERIGLAEASLALRTMRRWLAEQVGILEAGTKQRGMLRLAFDLVGIREASGRHRGMLRLVVETLGITELTRRTAALVRRIAERIGLTEVQARAGRQVRWFAEHIGLAESTRSARLIRGRVAELVSLKEVTSKAQGFARALAEAVSILEVRSRLSTLRRRVAELVGLTETEARTSIQVLVRIVVEQLSALETSLSSLTSRIGLILHYVVEGLGITEALRSTRTMRRRQAEQVAVVESMAARRTMRRWLAELVGLGESSGAARVMRRWVAEGLDLREKSGRISGFIRAVAERVAVAEAAARRRAITAIVSETMRIRERINSHDLVRWVNETIAIIESRRLALWPSTGDRTFRVVRNRMWSSIKGMATDSAGTPRTWPFVVRVLDTVKRATVRQG